MANAVRLVAHSPSFLSFFTVANKSFKREESDKRTDVHNSHAKLESNAESMPPLSVSTFKCI